MFSFEYCKIFKNAYFEEHLRTVASGLQQYFPRSSHYQTLSVWHKGRCFIFNFFLHLSATKRLTRINQSMLGPVLIHIIISNLLWLHERPDPYNYADSIILYCCKSILGLIRFMKDLRRSFFFCHCKVTTEPNIIKCTKF